MPSTRTLGPAFEAGHSILELDAVMSAWRLVSELWAFLRVRKQRSLLPLMPVLVLVELLLVLAHGSVPAPFIYSIF